ncbi:MAG: tRNA (adenosine(37)-N6)-dimethylallyltransferase MiaA [Dehalococcoidia bacterium]
MRRLVAIVGPTASGKSSVALECALRLGGEIVNADSRQVYRGMAIGTAQPAPADLRAVPHHLFGVAEANDEYSLALYQRQAAAALEGIWARDSFAWLVGGTGQYIWALLENWTVPEVPPDLDFRARMDALAADKGAAVLHDRLCEVDPTAAGRIDSHNIRRIVRALEVYEHTGLPISAWQSRGTPDFEYLLFGVDVVAEELARRIDARVDSMFAAGLVQEVSALLERGLPRIASAMASIGYREVAAHLAGESTLDEAIAATKRATRRLARRQGQWFRRDDPRITWIQDAASVELQANIFTGACTNVVRRSSRP